MSTGADLAGLRLAQACQDEHQSKIEQEGKKKKKVGNPPKR